MFPIIKSLKVTASFSYIWFKYVTGVNLDVHCAKCLLGEYSTHINNKTLLIQNLVMNEEISPAYYLCGVSKPYKWVNNFHLAFVYSSNSTIVKNENGIEVVILNAKEISITKIDMQNNSSPYRFKPEYNTCRNWQFANIYTNLKEYNGSR